jgi:hypothetical protein
MPTGGPDCPRGPFAHSLQITGPGRSRRAVPVLPVTRPVCVTVRVRRRRCLDCITGWLNCMTGRLVAGLAARQRGRTSPKWNARWCVQVAIQLAEGAMQVASSMLDSESRRKPLPVARSWLSGLALCRLLAGLRAGLCLNARAVPVPGLAGPGQLRPEVSVLRHSALRKWGPALAEGAGGRARPCHARCPEARTPGPGLADPAQARSCWAAPSASLPAARTQGPSRLMPGTARRCHCAAS